MAESGEGRTDSDVGPFRLVDHINSLGVREAAAARSSLMNGNPSISITNNMLEWYDMIGRKAEGIKVGP